MTDHLCDDDQLGDETLRWMLSGDDAPKGPPWGVIGLCIGLAVAAAAAVVVPLAALGVITL